MDDVTTYKPNRIPEVGFGQTEEQVIAKAQARFVQSVAAKARWEAERARWEEWMEGDRWPSEVITR